jgi:hypothetical protein
VLVQVDGEPDAGALLFEIKRSDDWAVSIRSGRLDDQRSRLVEHEQACEGTVKATLVYQGAWSGFSGIRDHRTGVSPAGRMVEGGAQTLADNEQFANARLHLGRPVNRWAHAHPSHRVRLAEPSLRSCSPVPSPELLARGSWLMFRALPPTPGCTVARAKYGTGVGAGSTLQHSMLPITLLMNLNGSKQRLQQASAQLQRHGMPFIRCACCRQGRRIHVSRPRPRLPQLEAL